MKEHPLSLSTLMLASCGHDLQWWGLYRKDYDLCIPESYAHPAKASWDLAFKILDHLKELGLLSPGSCVLDCMAGTGRFCIAACAQGYRAIGVELEPKFVAFCEQNKKYASRKLGKVLDWTILQGDSRHLSELLQERGLVTIVSPPYSDTGLAGGDLEARLRRLEQAGYKEIVRQYREGNPKARNFVLKGYGQSEGQIASLPDKPLKCVMSPPYEDSDTKKGEDWWRAHLVKRGRNPDGYGARQIYDERSKAEGQIGQERNESYLEAMRQVYSEIARVADILVVVVKCPTRAGKLRRLDLDTIALLESTGWTIRCVHHAMLFEEFETPTLFGETKKKVKGRLSFFKRLSWQKGSPIANHEDVIFATRGD